MEDPFKDDWVILVPKDFEGIIIEMDKQGISSTAREV